MEWVGSYLVAPCRKTKPQSSASYFLIFFDVFLPKAWKQMKIYENHWETGYGKRKHLDAFGSPALPFVKQYAATSNTSKYVPLCRSDLDRCTLVWRCVGRTLKVTIESGSCRGVKHCIMLLSSFNISCEVSWNLMEFDEHWLRIAGSGLTIIVWCSLVVFQCLSWACKQFIMIHHNSSWFKIFHPVSKFLVFHGVSMCFIIAHGISLYFIIFLCVSMRSFLLQNVSSCFMCTPSETLWSCTFRDVLSAWPLMKELETSYLSED